MNILHNHIGYDRHASKGMVVQRFDSMRESSELSAELIDTTTGETVARLRPTATGQVPGWKDRFFYTFDFSAYTNPGTYQFRVINGGESFSGAPFAIGDYLISDPIISDILHYYKGQRSSGRWDQADRHAPIIGERSDRVDVHGGWYDAAGDYSKYLSHLSYANYLNPQQIPLVAYAFFELGETLSTHPRFRDSLLEERAFEEAWWGSDFLMRMQDPAGYFYITLFDKWSKKSEARMICAFKTQQGELLENYQAGFRQGGGMAIASLARASMHERAYLPEDGFTPEQCLEAAKRGYAHLKKHNLEYLDNGRENIIDCYCALAATVELYQASGDSYYLQESRSWAARLIEHYSPADGCWMAESGSSRPFYHASDTGLPIMALLNYAGIEPEGERKRQTSELLVRVFEDELARCDVLFNPFGLPRQRVMPVGGESRDSFFIPHENETGYWWQGENARLASLACAARRGANALKEVPELAERLARFADSQLDWILGCNPFDTCMLQGHGRNNPRYEGHYPNAPGGICNGITAGFIDEDDIDFLPPQIGEKAEHRWRWSEQWIPHTAWFLMAVCAELRENEG
ncbi:MAG: glycoside hydrolase family 9 protein [Spirochaetota bacterium]